MKRQYLRLWGDAYEEEKNMGAFACSYNVI